MKVKKLKINEIILKDKRKKLKQKKEVICLQSRPVFRLVIKKTYAYVLKT